MQPSSQLLAAARGGLLVRYAPSCGPTLAGRHLVSADRGECDGRWSTGDCPIGADLAQRRFTSLLGLCLPWSSDSW